MHMTHIRCAGLHLGAALHAVAFLLLFAACSSEPQQPTQGEIAASVDDAVLTMSEVRKNIPGGLSPEDSARFVRGFVNAWVENQLVSRIASENIDMSEIDRLTDQYRNTLIMQEYRRQMFLQNAPSIPDDSISRYYQQHKGDFVLTSPLVKGVYLKVPDDAKNLRTIKRIYRSDKPQDIDRLEKEVLKSAIHYDYFRDRWVDWEQIETRIPYDFGASADNWLHGNKTLEHSAGGFTYLLYICEILPTGSPMPLEAAKPMILNRLLNLSRRTYDDALLKALYDQAEQEGRLKVNL